MSEPPDSDVPAHPPPGARPLVAFDFDGTLTVKDSFTAFVRWRARGAELARGLVALAPAAGAYLLRHDRGQLKSAAVRAFMQGATRAAVEGQARAFAAAAFESLMRPDALAAWARHRAEGARLVIVTASPEEIVAPFAERLGADALIGSRLDWAADGRVGAGLAGPNCRGPEKVARLRARFGDDVRLAAAYGDSAGDREMLALADRPGMRCFTGRPSAAGSHPDRAALP